MIPRLVCFNSRDGEKTSYWVCGKTYRSFYDHKLRRVRDLSCGDTRIYLEIEVRRDYLGSHVCAGSCGA